MITNAPRTALSRPALSPQRPNNRAILLPVPVPVPVPVRTRTSTRKDDSNKVLVPPRARRDRESSTERFQFDQATAKKSFKYVKVVTKYAFGVDIDAYIPLIVAGGSLLALVTFGLSGLFVVAASALGVILASSFIFLSLGWLFVPLVSFMVIGTLAAGVGSFLLFPALALGAVFALVSTLSSVAFARLDDKMIDEVIDSLDDDDRFDREELERFDARLRRRSESSRSW